jgi:hypothetical protein
MLQTNDNHKALPLLNLVYEFWEAAGYTFGASVRSLKRLFGQEVTPQDYNQIWAETNIDGSEVHGSGGDAPEYILCATRVRNSDNWAVQIQRRLPDLTDNIVFPSQFTTFNDFNPFLSVAPQYEIFNDLGILTIDKVKTLMRRADPEPRSSPSHYSRAFGMK